MRPLSLAGSPFASFFHVSPPSADFHSALPGPPPGKPYALRMRWYEAAYIVLGSDGSIATSTTPGRESPPSTPRQVWRPSVVWYRPRSSLGRHRWPMAATNTVL